MTRKDGLPADMEFRRNAKVGYALEKHLVEVAGSGGRWTVSVDGVAIERTFATHADAWTAGIVEADRLDQA